MNVTEAARAAADAVVNGRYEFVNEGGSSYRIPVIHPKAGTNLQQSAPDISAGARHILDKLESYPIATPYISGDTPADIARATYLEELPARAYWVTSADESGLTLYDSADNRAVMLDDGTPFTVSWLTLMDRGVVTRDRPALPPGHGASDQTPFIGTPERRGFEQGTGSSLPVITIRGGRAQP